MREGLRLTGSTALLLVACVANDEGPGVRPVPGAPVAIDVSPLLVVGVEDGDVNQQFDRVATPFLLPGGRLVVPVGGANTIRVFGPSGEFLQSYGREGAGPGEFAWLSSAWARGDTIEAFDSDLRRITRFHPDGMVEVVTLKSGLPDLSAIAGPVADGWMLGGVESGDVGRRDTIVVQRFASDGSFEGEVGRTVGFARFQGPMLTGPEPLSPRSALAIAQGRAWIAETLSPRIEVRVTADSLEREIVWQPEHIHDAREVMRAVEDSAVARARPDRAAAVRRQMQAAPLPERVSVFWDFLVDDAGFVWIRDFEPMQHAAALGGLTLGGGQGGRWSVLSANGDRVGSIDVPAGLEPVRVTLDAVVGISRDSLGVERVRVHRLRRNS